MKTQILGVGSDRELALAVASAVQMLREGEAIALPTETVYGLAADALNVDAALKIFEAKERPRFDPLIVHLPGAEWLTRIAKVEGTAGRVVATLTAKFWPGPLTIVLPRASFVPDLVTAGLETVAVRVSAHPVFSAIVQVFAGPLAAPSANRFGRISPTTAAHVAAELDGCIPLIIDAGPTDHGLESTIVAVRDEIVEVLRPGPITLEQLREFGDVHVVAARGRIVAPGQLPSHYAPRTPLVVVEDVAKFQLPLGKRCGLLAWKSAMQPGFAEHRQLSVSGDLREAGANLFRYVRELDNASLDLIVAERITDAGLGNAIMDRLTRAAAR
ncbi:MAG: L-threonylcarbamoyladenylate synthase [Verrucomicrobiota bacterium]|nr:L-threonylcarbamoyladenylate synthase [Verrucomicrobiota bacterium]